MSAADYFEEIIYRLCPTGVWAILRKPRQGADFVLRDIAGSKEQLLNQYETAFTSLRQGCIVLVGPKGKIERIASGPNLRSRW